MMKFLGTVFEFGKNINFGTVFECGKNIKEGWEIMETITELYGYHSGLEESMQTLKRKAECLGTQVSEELQQWKKRKTEVEFWCNNEQQMKADVQKLKKEVVGVGKRNVFSRVRLGKRIAEKIQEVEELQKRGRALNDALVDEVPTGRLLMPPTRDFVEFTEARNVERVWECLMNDEDRKIGVFGMGGVGKTTIMKHIHNRLLEETDMFDAVFWVKVSKPFNIKNLQSDIANALKHSLSDTEETKRASELYTTLRRRKKYVFILDDVWEAFDLERVGIPEPTKSNGCKLVLTTRLLEECRRMECTTVKVGFLTEKEALMLFLNRAFGHARVLDPEVEEIASKIARKCARLPLAIATVGGSMRGFNGEHQWRCALNEFINSTKDISDGERSEVFQQLKFSYSRLGNEMLQNCFLFVSLYPEDHNIPVEELIEYWIAEELIADMNSVQAQFDEGHTILDKLTDTSLLESFIDKDGDQFIRIHDVIRDMALKITASSPRFMVKARESIDSVAYEQWSEDLERISFMGSWITELPITPPVCPRLTTLLLSYNYLKEIPDSFFTYIHCLHVLDLTCNYKIESLPESISDFKNLHALILYDCRQLQYVPSLQKLKALKVFTLTSSRIEKVPEGIEELVNLIKLDLSNNFTLRMFPTSKLRRLSKLRFLKMDGTKINVSAEDLLCLRELKVVAAHFHNVKELARYATSQHWQGMEKYCLTVGAKQDDEVLTDKL